jgi:hypothetical protein
MKGCWILSKAFSVSIERIMWLFSMLLFICCITFIDLCLLNYTCIPGMKSTHHLLMCCWTLFATILLRTFPSIFIKDIGLQCSFLVASLLGFGMSIMIASENKFGCDTFLSISWKTLRSICVSSLKVLSLLCREAVYYCLDFIACNRTI